MVGTARSAPLPTTLHSGVDLAVRILQRGRQRGVGLRCHRRHGLALVRMQLLSPDAKMANDGIDAFTRPSQPSSMLRQPGLYPCDRSPAQPADLQKLAPRVQGNDLGKENGAIRSASHDERSIRRIRHQLNDPLRQIRVRLGISPRSPTISANTARRPRFACGPRFLNRCRVWFCFRRSDGNRRSTACASW